MSFPIQAQMDFEASRRRRRGDAYIQESQQNTELRTEPREAKLVVDRNCNASVVSVDKMQNEVDKSPKRRPSRRQGGEELDQAARASTGDLGQFSRILSCSEIYFLLCRWRSDDCEHVGQAGVGALRHWK